MSHTLATIAVPGGNVWFKTVGGGPGLPLLVVHGGPGMPHCYLSSLKRLADEREVVFWDQLGCGNSERPSNGDLWTMERSVAEMDAVVRGLGLDRFHIFGHSWGGMLAQQYVLDTTSGAASLTISNSMASIARYTDNMTRLKSGLDAETQSAIDRHETAGTTHSVEYQEVIRTWNEAYLCRVLPWPDELHEAVKNTGAEVCQTLVGPNLFRVVGTIRDWDVVDRLSEITLPALLLAGRHDACSPEHMWEMHQCIAGSRIELFESTAHMPFIEEPAQFDQVMREFLRIHD